MTMHAVVLPGYQPHTTKCRHRDCRADLGLVQRAQHFLRKWEEALESGPTAIDAYLREHNAEALLQHDLDCPVRDLPPAVHASCHGIDDEGRDALQQLRYHQQKLAEARARGDQPPVPRSPWQIVRRPRGPWRP